jgi:hypothetical protein
MYVLTVSRRIRESRIISVRWASGRMWWAGRYQRAAQFGPRSYAELAVHPGQWVSSVRWPMNRSSAVNAATVNPRRCGGKRQRCRLGSALWAQQLMRPRLRGPDAGRASSSARRHAQVRRAGHADCGSGGSCGMQTHPGSGVQAEAPGAEPGRNAVTVGVRRGRECADQRLAGPGRRFEPNICHHINPRSA